MTDLTPYASVDPLIASAPQWVVDPLERARIASYTIYEKIYWMVPDTFKVVLRGDNDRSIYLPPAKTIVETLHRFMGRDLTIVPDPAYGTPNDQALALQVLTDIFARERFMATFNANKRYGIIRGDWLFHFYADPLKPPGTKITIEAVDPGSWFPIFADDNPDKMIGMHIVDTYTTDEGELRIKRLTYRKEVRTEGAPATIAVEEGIFKIDEWGGPGMDEEGNPEEVTIPLMDLPAPIDALPIYSIRNFEEPGNPYGSSELRGFESLLGGLNQAVSDADLSLAMEGLGVYWSDAGEPLDDSGQPAGWQLGPARVVGVPKDHTFGRVDGVKTLAPYQEHLKYLGEQIMEGTGTPAVARGRVEVDVAESGIALLMEMGPILARGGEREETIKATLQQMFFDFGKWQTAYEGTQFKSLFEVTRWSITFGNPIPTNTAKVIEQVGTLTGGKVISNQTGREWLRTAGVPVPEEADEAGRLAAEAEAAQAAALDAFGGRLGSEMEEEDPDAPVEP